MNFIFHFFRTLKKNWRAIFWFELWYRVLSIGLILPLLQKIMSGSLKWFHYSYLTPNNILRYLSDIRVIAILFVMGFLILLCMLFEVCCLFSCFRSSDRDYQIQLTEMLWMGFEKTIHLIKNYKVMLFVWLVFLFPVMNLHLLFEWNQPIINYLVEIVYMTVPNKGLFLIGIILLIILGLFSCYFLSTAILNRNEKVNLGKIAEELKRNLCFAVIALLIFNGILLSFIALCYIIMALVGIVIIKLFFNEHVVLLRALEYSDHLWYVMFCVSGLVDVLFNSVFIYCMHERTHQGQILFHFDVPVQRHLSYTVKKRMQLLVMAGYVLVAFVFVRTFYHGSSLLHGVMNPISVTAHRGGASVAPENTLEALQQAIDYTADYAEIDVQETADGIVVLLHDFNLKRTTGFNAYVYNLTYDKVRQLDAGSYFSSKYAGAVVPTLVEAMQLCKGKINLNIEIKSDKHYSDDLPEKVVTLIQEYNFVEQCVVTSTNYSYLKRVKEMNPNITTGYILKMSMGNIASLEYADFFSMKYSYVTEKIVEQIHSAGKQVHVWTVNTTNGINQMKLLGVDNIITDNIALVRKILTREDGKESWSELLYLFLNRQWVT